jgi:2-oxo-3-hexenedioate decarboxylase
VSDLAGIAATLDQAMQRAEAVPQLQAQIGLDEAYAVMDMALRLRVGRGERIVGMKMGFTSRAKMVQMGIDEMIFGRLTDAMQVEEGGATPRARYVHPRVEPEIAFRLKRSLAGRVTHLEALAAVEAIAPAVEIIDSRYRDFKFSLSDVVADNSSSSGFVVGAARTPDLDISNLGMAFWVDGVLREVGSSAAILGNPWRSLIAAAAFAERYGFELRPGDIVLAGGATAAVAAGEGARVLLQTQNLSPVAFSFC